MPGQHIRPSWSEFDTETLLRHRALHAAHLAERPSHKPTQKQIEGIDRALSRKEPRR